MILGLTPVERIWLACALIITGQQLVRGSWDPVAVAAIAAFIGLIPTGRADRKKNRDDPPPEIELGDSTKSAAQQVIQRYLDRTGGSS